MESLYRRDSLARLISAAFALIFFLFSGIPTGFAEDCTDDRIEKGIKLYDEGKFDGAIQELRSFTKKLHDGPRGDSTSQCSFKANLFIGMAYLGTGKEGQAREYFRNAARAMPCTPLNPDTYPPKAISLYDDACKRLPPPSPSGLLVKSNVPDAEVFVDEAAKGRAPVRIDVPPGPHVVKVLHGTQKREQTYVIKPGQRLEVTIDFNILGHISVSSEPASVDIYLDGTLLGVKTPALVRDSTAGVHTLRLSKEGFLESTQKVTVKADEVTTVNIRLEPLSYTAKIASDPVGAEVLWDGVAKGRTPLVIGNVTAGRHKIALGKEHYEEHVETIDVQNSSIEKTYSLRPHMGTVVIATNPAGAEVFVDGKSEGTTPLRREYPPKSYSLRLQQKGYKEKNMTFDITRNRETTISENLLVIDTRPPEITFVPAPRIIKENSYHVRAAATDDQAMGPVSLMFRPEGDRDFKKTAMTGSGKNLYDATIPDQYLKKDGTIEFYMVACDMQENCSESGRKDTPYRLKVTSLEPYTEGYVLDIDKDRKVVTVSMASPGVFDKQDSLYVFRLGRRYTDPATGNLLGIEEVLVGTLKVRELMPRTALAVIDDEASATHPIAKNDRIRKRVGPPADLRSEGRYATKVVLKWTPNREPEVRGYAVYRSRAADGDYERIEEIEGRDNASYEDKKGMMERLSFYYRIAAVNKLGTAGVLTEPFMARTKAGLPAPDEVRGGRRGIREVLLSWNISRRDPDIESYLVYRASSQGEEFTQIAQVNNDTQSYLDQGNHLADGKTYYYKVAGKSIHGSVGDMSAVVPVTTKGGPSPPKIRTHGNMAKTISIEWEKDPEDTVSGYNVFRKEREDGILELYEKTENTSFTEKGLEDGKKYYYCIQGYYRHQKLEIRGSCSDMITVQTRPLPATPTGFSAEGGLARKVKLKWDKSNDRNVMEYWIDRKKKGSGFIGGVIGEITLKRFKVKVDIDNYTDTDRLDDNTQYGYQIMAYDRDELKSAWTPELIVRTKPAPVAPSGLTARLADDKVILNWNANREKDVVEYKIYRKAQFLSSSDLLATVRNTSFETKIPADSKPEYIVTAVDVDGLESDSSSTVSVEIKK